jgi:hypothetical protein
MTFKVSSIFGAKVSKLNGTKQANKIAPPAGQVWAASGAHAKASGCRSCQKACSFEEKGNNEEAKTWWQIEAALKLMRGPHEG